VIEQADPEEERPAAAFIAAISTGRRLFRAQPCQQSREDLDAVPEVLHAHLAVG
jgi:hypothetical protein